MPKTGTLKQTSLVLIALIAWLAVLVQIISATKGLVADGRSLIFGVINTLSYFTILTNLLLAIVTTACFLRGDADTLLTRPSTQSAVALYIFVVGLIYTLLLRATWSPTGLNAVLDTALHDVTPVLYVLYWLLFVPKGTLRWSLPLYWLVYPLLYVAYCILRGALTGFYPYHFADVTLLGYPRALLNTAFLLLGFWVLGMVLVAIDRLLARSRSASTKA
ncbi:Pr6Pr family membrane protein [Tunturibacter empetritectus]|uniref:FAR-17a/AIG1-like protein n=1 Tax=Tunturiibacter lichenicola TaxID=2051959 RepID=A0A7W8J8C3_9BACT|nr:Pr6Pr family membrane protein [Edaphobacter lichenicola]MBB5344505.1 hypothetical protein [Edaphobacter lichenicola]